MVNFLLYCEKLSVENLVATLENIINKLKQSDTKRII